MEEKNYVPKRESMTFAIAALGQGLVYSCMSSYITDFYMNVVKLGAVFVILLMLLARVWDAIQRSAHGYDCRPPHFALGKIAPLSGNYRNSDCRFDNPYVYGAVRI